MALVTVASRRVAIEQALSEVSSQTELLSSFTPGLFYRALNYQDSATFYKKSLNHRDGPATT